VIALAALHGDNPVEGMSLETNSAALLFLLGDELPETLRIQGKLLGAGLRNPIFTMEDLQAARAQLLEMSAAIEWKRCPEPHLIVLSLQKGWEALSFLQWLRAEQAFARTLVVVLADRAQRQTLQQAMDLGANAFCFRESEHELLTDALCSLRYFTPERELAAT
jgi:DNA-binding NarL/FixJ family response regulator